MTRHQGVVLINPAWKVRLPQCPLTHADIRQRNRQSALCQHTWWDLLDQLVSMSLQVLELGMEASGERVHRAAVGVVGGVGDELIVEAEAHVG